VTARALWQVAAGGRFITRLGRRCWQIGEALEIARDLRGRGYQDAHAQRWIEGDARLPPFALTLVYRGKRFEPSRCSPDVCHCDEFGSNPIRSAPESSPEAIESL